MPVPSDWRHAPNHLLAMVSSLADRPAPGPRGEPTPEQWAALVRRVVDSVWSTAWVAGAAYAQSIAPPAPIVFEAPPPAGGVTSRLVADVVAMAWPAERLPRDAVDGCRVAARDLLAVGVPPHQVAASLRRVFEALQVDGEAATRLAQATPSA